MVVLTSVHVHGIKNTLELEKLYQHYQQTRHTLPHQDVDSWLGMCIFCSRQPMTHLCFQDLLKDTQKKIQVESVMPY